MEMSQAPAAPLEEQRRHPHWRRLLIGGLVIVVIGAAADLLGWNIRGWLDELWDTMSGISLGYLVAGVALKTVQTTATAFAWYGILRYAYPTTRFRLVLACYAASVALNGILPANLGTFALLLMFTTIIAGATFSGVLGAYVVEKIFFTIIGAFTYLYLFLSVSGSFDIKFDFVHQHPWATVILVVGGAALIYTLAPYLLAEGRPMVGPGEGRWRHPERAQEIPPLGVRALAPRVDREPRRDGRLPGRIRHPGQLRHAHADLRRQLDRERDVGHTRRRRRQPGVQRCFAEGVTDPTTATAYSVSQQLVTTAWNIIFGIVLLVWAFGWSGGKELVQTSYAGAKEKAAEQKDARAARKEAKRAAKHA
jgi:hypothetical protein